MPREMDTVDLGDSEAAGGAEAPDAAPAKRASTAADRASARANCSILLAEANMHAAAGRFDDAVASLATALALDPSNVDVLDALDECRSLQSAGTHGPFNQVVWLSNPSRPARGLGVFAECGERLCSCHAEVAQAAAAPAPAPEPAFTAASVSPRTKGRESAA